MEYGQLVHVEELHRGGVHYRIAVFHGDDGLHGEWSCNVCSVAYRNGMHPTIEESVAETRKLIDEHHGAMHELS